MRFMLATAVLCLSIGVPPAHAADPVSLKYFVEVEVPDLENAKILGLDGFDIAGVDRKTRRVGLVVTPDELTKLQQYGWPVAIRSHNLDSRSVAALSDYTDPQELSLLMDQIVAAHPTLAKKILLQGTLFDAQKQYALKITQNVDVPNDRPAFLMDAQHHAREVMTPEIARDMMEYLTSRYAIDPEVQRWLENINIYIVPSVNPDGGMYVFTNDVWWRKNRHPSCPVDNNRNYTALWGSCNGSSASCSSETYRGTSAGSEPETQGLMQLTSDVRPFFALSYHSYGEYIMYPYGCNDPDELEALDAVAQVLNSNLPNDAGATGQWATGPIWSTIYLADGGSIDTQYNRFGAYGFLIEVNSSGFQPDYATWRNITVERQRIAWKYFLDQTLDGAQIRGTVTDAGTGLPIAADVALQEVTFTHGELPRRAGTNGRYRLLAKSGQTYHPTFSYPGYCSATHEVTVGSGPVVLDVTVVRPAIPTGVTATASGNGAIDVTWQAAANADQYRIYRSFSAGGPFTPIATVPATETSYHDTPVSGSVPYFYTVRGIQGCESASSNVASAATTGPCTAGPDFAGLASAVNGAASTCAVTLSWPAAASRCGNGVTFQVYRSATAPFVPSPATLIASGLTGTGFADHDALADGSTYHYIVRAFDAANHADDGNLVRLAAAPTGPFTTGTWSDDAGDLQAAKLNGAAPWSVLPLGGKTNPKVYATGNYQDNTCAALTTPAIQLAAGASLSFASKYDLETNYDAGIVEVAAGPSYASWTKLGINYPDPLSFLGNACGFQTSGASTVFSRTFATPAYAAAGYSGSLAAYAGQSVKLRWSFSTDGGVVGKGWWVDDIAVANASLPGICSSGQASSPHEPGALRASRAAGTSVQLSYTPGCGTLDNAVYWGAGPIAGGLSWSGAACALGNTGVASFDPGHPAPDSFIYFILAGQNGAAESSYGLATAGERTEASGVGACDRPQVLGGSCP